VFSEKNQLFNWFCKADSRFTEKDERDEENDYAIIVILRMSEFSRGGLKVHLGTCVARYGPLDYY
jgi:hypothetical protein